METAHAITTSHFHPHLPGTFGANKPISVVSSNCLNYPRQCFEEQRLYFTIVQKTHPIPPYKFCSSYKKNRNYLTAKILFKIITALIVRYRQVKNCLLLLVIRLPSAEVRLQSLGCYTKPLPASISRQTGMAHPLFELCQWACVGGFCVLYL